MGIKDKHDLSPEEQAAHEQKWGGYNDFPPSWKEIDERTFAKSDFFGWSPVLTEFRQMLKRESRDPVLSTRLFFMPSGCGYSIVSDFYAGTVKYYRFGELDPNWLKDADSSD